MEAEKNQQILLLYSLVNFPLNSVLLHNKKASCKFWLYFFLFRSYYSTSKYVNSLFHFSGLFANIHIPMRYSNYDFFVQNLLETNICGAVGYLFQKIIKGLLKKEHVLKQGNVKKRYSNI